VTIPPLLAGALGPLVAATVWRAGMLTGSGALAAAAIGSAAALAGVDWMLLLLTFFASSVLLGRLGRDTKRSRSAEVIEKSGARDATQVLANGALFGGAATVAVSQSGVPLMSGCTGTAPLITAIGLGALAAATADTWGTEIGMLSRTPPRSILTWKPLEPGMSGGVSLLGLTATVVGAVSLALLAWLLGWSRATTAAAAIGGIAGATTDSVLGASFQQRRRSLATGRMTERQTDDRGEATVLDGGLAWLDNDGVNFAATVIGASVAAGLSAAFDAGHCA
jgi:uncharacterized protein (TIGR00297 family)